MSKRDGRPRFRSRCSVSRQTSHGRAVPRRKERAREACARAGGEIAAKSAVVSLAVVDSPFHRTNHNTNLGLHYGANKRWLAHCPSGVGGDWVFSAFGLAQAEMKLNLQEPITALGREVYDLHLLMTIVCGVIFVAVFGVMFWSVFVHRKSAGYKAATFHESTTVEILWTIVPVFILLGMAWPATKTILAMRDTTNADITIKATGYQWKWGYDYLKGEGEGISFVSTLATPQPQIRNENAKGRITCSKSTTNSSCRSARRFASSRLRTTSSTPGGCRPSRSSRTPCRVSSAIRGSGPKRPVLSRPVRRAVRQGTRLTCRSWSKS
jgi:hypothetical protein